MICETLTQASIPIGDINIFFYIGLNIFEMFYNVITYKFKINKK